MHPASSGTSAIKENHWKNDLVNCQSKRNLDRLNARVRLVCHKKDKINVISTILVINFDYWIKNKKELQQSKKNAGYFDRVNATSRRSGLVSEEFGGKDDIIGLNGGVTN